MDHQLSKGRKVYSIVLTFSPALMDGLVLAHALGLSVLTNRHLGLMYVESFQGLCEQQQKKKNVAISAVIKFH